MTCQHGQGVLQFAALLFQADRFGLGGGQFGLRPGDIELPDLAVFEQTVDQAEVFPAQFDGALQQLDFGIERAQGKVVAGDLGLQGKKQALVIGLAGLGIGPGGFDRTAHPPPEIDLVAQVQRDVVIIESNGTWPARAKAELVEREPGA